MRRRRQCQRGCRGHVPLRGVVSRPWRGEREAQSAEREELVCSIEGSSHEYARSVIVPHESLPQGFGNRGVVSSGEARQSRSRML